MIRDLIPRSFWNVPSRFPVLFDEDWDDWMPFTSSSGLSVSEDDKQVYVEAALPGVDPNKIEVTYQNGVLWIRGGFEETEEDKKRKYYRKASQQYSYRLSVPEAADEAAEPEVTHKNGLLRITFPKAVKAEQPKRLKVKAE